MCGKSARTDLCGRCRVTGIPTAIMTNSIRRFVRRSFLSSGSQYVLVYALTFIYVTVSQFVTLKKLVDPCLDAPYHMLPCVYGHCGVRRFTCQRRRAPVRSAMGCPWLYR